MHVSPSCYIIIIITIIIIIIIIIIHLIYIASISITVLGALQYHALQFQEKCIKTTLTKKKLKNSIQI